MGLFAHVWQQRHKASPLDRQGNSVLAYRHAAALSPADNLAMAIDQLFQQFDVLIINEHRTRTLAVDPNRVLLLGFELWLGPLAGLGVFGIESRGKGHVSRSLTDSEFAHPHGKSDVAEISVISNP